MGSININNGQAISMGDNNIISGNSIGAELKVRDISKEDIEILKHLAENISLYRSKDVKVSEMMSAGALIANLAEASEDENKEGQVESISAWKKFKLNASPKVIEAINLVSSGITIGTFLKELLGI